MKILVTPTSFKKPQNNEARAKLEAYADEVVYNNYGRPLEAGEVAHMLSGVDGYVAGLDYISTEALKFADSLKVISRYGAGIDRIDLTAAKNKGIIVTNTPGTNSVAVCELAFGLMLSLARAIPMLDADVKKGEWPRNNGVELCGKTLGIIGFGAIGKKLATRSKAFEMKVMAFDPYFDEAFAEKQGIIKSDFKDLLAESDFISLHVPLNENTKNMINDNCIKTMKHGVFIINTARGGLIDETAAAKALKSGKLGGMALDAFEIEPPLNSPLFGLDNLIMTPHIGANTNEAISGMGMESVDNLIEVLEGKDCKNIIGDK